MYAQLGTIVFEALKGFTSWTDNVSANWVEHANISSKSRLQKIAENLNEINLTIQLHNSFCVPEDEYENIKKYVTDGEVVSFVLGNGVVLGDFVIPKLGRVINHTSPSGDHVSVTLDITLKEFYDPNALKKQQARAKKNAFAVDAVQPLPANTLESSESPAFASLVDIQDSKKEGTFFSNAVEAVNKANEKIDILIDKAQKFRDKIQVAQAKMTSAVDKLDAKINSVQDFLNVYTSANLIAPNLQGKLDACKASSLASRNLITTYASLPGIVNTPVEAAYVLSVQDDTNVKQLKLVSDLNDLTQAAQPLAVHSATGKPL